MQNGLGFAWWNKSPPKRMKSTSSASAVSKISSNVLKVSWSKTQRQ